MFKRALIIFIFLIGILLNASYVFAGTILSSYKHAWSNNVGYINLENVVVDDGALSGFAWSANAGWIKFNPTQGGVLNDGAGNLSGFAWGEGLGWIDFSGVKISTSTGKFSGIATGTLVGTLTFDCPTYCDVRTDWRPVSVCTAWTYSDWNSCSNNLQTRTVLSATPSGCSGGSPVLSQSCSSSVLSSGSRNRSGNNIYSHVDSYNEDLTILPSQSGTYTKDTSVGKIILDVPTGDVSDGTTFFINEESLDSANLYLVSIGAELVNNVFYNITAVDKNGNPVHFFTHPITITLPVSLSLFGEENLGVYWFNDINQQWVLIPDAVFSYGKVTFQINHLTIFSIFLINDKDIPVDTSGGSLTGEKNKTNLPIIGNKKPVLATNTVDIMPTQNLYENSILFLIFALIVLIILLFKEITTRKRMR
ncbi:MAG: hypothetical protein WCP24_00210 [bacterium]